MATAITTDYRGIASLARRAAYVVIGGVICLATIFGLKFWRESKRRFGQLAIHESRLSQMRIALQYYFDDYHGSFAPHSASPRVSWRVKLLTFMEQKAIFDQYDFDQPWDSAANGSLQQCCPRSYTSEPEQECSDILLVTSGDSDEEPVATNALLLAIDSGIFNVPWTRPQDITFQELDATLRQRIRQRQLSSNYQVWIAIPSQPTVPHQLITLQKLLERIAPEVKP